MNDRKYAFEQEVKSISEVIIDQMKNTDGNWLMPWHKGLQPAKNAQKGILYSGSNYLRLWARCIEKVYELNLWATLNQWRKLKATVKKGEKGTLLFYPVKANTKLKNGQKSEYIKYYKPFHVFNVAQVNNYNPNHPDLFSKPFSKKNKVEQIIQNSKADIEFEGDKAFYRLPDDFIRVPKRSSFIDTDQCSSEHAFYSTIIHEFIHWTGHKPRCDRPFFSKFGSPTYAFEELIAELGAAFVCTDLKIEIKPRISHAKYLKGWLKVLNNDFRFLTEAISYATNAMEWLYINTGVEDIGLLGFKKRRMSSELINLLTNIDNE